MAVLIAASAVGVGLTCWRRHWLAAAVCLAIVASAASAGVRVHLLHGSPVAALAQDRAVVTAHLRLRSDVRVLPSKGIRPELASATATLVWMEARGRRHEGALPMRLVGTGPLARELADLSTGAVIAVEGRLAPADPGDLVAAELRLGAAQEVAPPVLAMRVINHVRRSLVKAMAHSPPDQAGLVPSLVVGDTSGLSEAVRSDFRDTGLTHLTAVSGTNLTLVLVFLLTIARWLGVRGRWLWLVQVAGVVVFVALCRAEPSVVRASAMGLVAMAALGRTRDRRRGVRHLATAVLVLVLLDPGLSRSWGFALSVAATAGILILAPGLLRATTWLPRGVAEAVVVPTSAQLATTPLVVALSGELAAAGLGANVVVAPFVGPATVLGLVAALVGSVWAPAALPFGWVAGWFVEPLLVVAHAGARLPGATRVWPPGPWAMLLLVLGCLLATAVLPWLLTRRWVALAMALALVVALGRPPVVPGWPGRWEVVFCDVGQGDATVLRSATGSAVVVDVGPDPRPTLACLDALAVREIPLLVLTHFHADHIGGLEGVLASRRVGLVITSRLPSPAAAASGVLEAAGAHGTPVRQAVPGERWQAGEVTWTTLQAGAITPSVQQGAGESAVENDSSVAGVATTRNLRVLLLGDLEPEGQRALVRSAGDAVQADIVKMPHHGSSHQHEPLWTLTGAQLAVASAGRDNDYGHPSARTLGLARRLGMEVARTDQQGSVAVSEMDEQLQVVSTGVGRR